jgi:hypothetical protein
MEQARRAPQWRARLPRTPSPRRRERRSRAPAAPPWRTRSARIPRHEAPPLASTRTRRRRLITMPHCAAGPGVDGVPAVCCTAAAHGMAYQAEIEGPKRVCTAHGVGGLADHLPPAPAAHLGATSRPAQGPQRGHGDQAVASGSSGVGADGCSPAVRCGARGGRLCGLFHPLRCSRRRTLVAARGPRVRRCPAAGTGASGACAALRRV